ncbi:M20/M25/M40 family metallo-hydrolase [Gottschalkiaceae bacterium SANA]|nr:M20/M25/M40 family metallo-hydrolase [Gottschalkiaceae bacterium SANA]
MLKLLKQLVKIDSSSQEGANQAIEVAAAYLKNHGIDGTIVACQGWKSYVAVLGQGEKTLIWNGHLDVVSGCLEQFEPLVQEGRLIGRGSADMKGGCVAMMEAFIALKDHPLSSKVMLQLVPDEEIGGVHGTKYLVEEGYVGDFVICTEPTQMKVSLQAKGILRVLVHTSGKAAHGSRPWEGENAIAKAMENVERIKALPILNEGSAFYKKSSINLAFISGGDIYNRVPDACTLGLDIRYVPHLDASEIVSAIEEIVDGKIEIEAMEPGVCVAENAGEICQLKESMALVAPDLSLEMTAQHGASDGRFYAGRGIPAIEFGPTGAAWHGDHEYVELESIEQLRDILIHYALHFS